MLEFKKNSKMFRYESNYQVPYIYDISIAKYIISKIDGRWWLRIWSDGDGRYVFPSWSYRINGKTGSSTKKEIVEWLNDQDYETADPYFLSF